MFLQLSLFLHLSLSEKCDFDDNCKNIFNNQNNDNCKKTFLQLSSRFFYFFYSCRRFYSCRCFYSCRLNTRVIINVLFGYQGYIVHNFLTYTCGLLEGLTLFAENTGLIVGRTLVDLSGWKVPVLVSNFSQDTIVVAPFSEVGMVTLPVHLQDLLDQTSRDLDVTQQRQLADVLLQYSDLFPVPGSPLTGHTDAMEHEIVTGDGSPIHCATRRLSPQKMKKKRCVLLKC